jgi:predicted metal-dependent enzyme (double-stranded beta helix superfamily)
MSDRSYSIPQLAADLEQVCQQFSDDCEIIAAVRPLARKAALASETWLEDRLYVADSAQGYGVHLLHEKPDHALAIFAVCWLPHRGTPPHDHGTWAVVAGVDGPERNEFFERADDGSCLGYAELKKIGEKVCQVGDVVAMPRGTIHSVWNDSDTMTVSLHLYGRHLNHTIRSQFDIERKNEAPFVVKIGA